MRIPRFHSVFQFACAVLAVGALIAQSSPGAMADTLHATDDAYIQTDDADENKGSSSKVKLKDDGGDDDRIGLGKFDLSTLPTGLTADEVVKATLRVWVEKVWDEGSMTVKSADGDWDEEDVTADNGPSAGAFSSAMIDVSEDDEESFVTIDITELVKSPAISTTTASVLR